MNDELKNNTAIALLKREVNSLQNSILHSAIDWSADSDIAESFGIQMTNSDGTLKTLGQAIAELGNQRNALRAAVEIALKTFMEINEEGNYSAEITMLMNALGQATNNGTNV